MLHVEVSVISRVPRENIIKVILTEASERLL